jgi:hypothetical protein
MQNTQISFTPDNITIGIYHIEFWFTPIAEDIILQINEPLFLECEIEICQGKKTKSKKLNLTVDKGTLGKSRLLFVVPIEFMPNFMQEIIFTIKNVTFDVNFMNYYESIKFALVRSSMFFK